MSAVLLLLRKDLRVLRRSPLLLGALVAYPIVIALLVGLVAGYAAAKPRVAFVDDDNLPQVIVVGGHRFHIQTVIDDVAKQVTLVRLSDAEAARELDNGKVVATITVPPGFLGDLETTVVSPHLILKTGSGGLAPRVTQQVQSLVYQLNQKLQGGYIAANLAFVKLLLHGGHGKFVGKQFDVLGLDRTSQELAKLPQSKRVVAIANFVRQAKEGLAQTGEALRATANPIALQQATSHGRTWLLSAQVQSYGIAVTVTFLALLLAAGTTAAERDEGTIGRLRRGLVSLGQLVWSKVALAAVVGLVLGAAIAILFGDRRRRRRRHRGRAVGPPAAPPRRRGPRCGRRRRRGHAARGARARGAHRVAPRRADRPAGGLPRPRAARRRAARVLGQPLPAVRARGPALRRRALRHEPVARGRRGSGLARGDRRGLVGAGPPGRAYSFGVSSFPEVRLRRFRRTGGLRGLVRETRLSLDQFVMPLFVAPEALRDEALPAMSRVTVDGLLREVEDLVRLGVRAVILFGIPDEKDEEATGAWEEDGIVQQALRALRPEFPDLVLVTDVCLCEYTSHGHCGVIVDGEVHNDRSLELLARTAVSHAEAGADVVAPSDMMDGRVRALREALDDHSFESTPILSYAAKYASAFYGPFREAAGSSPSFGDRRGYQMDPANVREALRECELDLDEGADALIIKPALPYLDVIRAAREAFDAPIAAYNVSGEYAMVKAAARSGWLDERQAALESLTAIKRAGADLIISYWTKDLAAWL